MLDLPVHPWLQCHLCFLQAPVNLFGPVVPPDLWLLVSLVGPGVPVVPVKARIVCVHSLDKWDCTIQKAILPCLSYYCDYVYLLIIFILEESVNIQNVHFISMIGKYSLPVCLQVQEHPGNLADPETTKL